MGRVSGDVFEKLVDEVSAGCRRPEHGLFGPTSISWRVARESVIFAGGGRAALLQLAHPYVAHAIDQHSETRRDPIGRFNRTFTNVFAMIFGDLDQAIDTAHRVRAIHDSVRGVIDEDVGIYDRGAPYSAHEQEALAWVYATLIDTAVLVHDLVLPALSVDEREKYYQESLLFAQLFGLGPDALPPHWSAFQRYMRERLNSAQISVGGPAAEIGRFLMTPQTRRAAPAVRWLRALTSGLMPPRLREPFGLRFDEREQRRYMRSLRLLRAVYPRLPARARFIPAYFEAQRRLSGRPGPDRFGRAVEAWVLRFLGPSASATSGCPVPHRSGK